MSLRFSNSAASRALKRQTGEDGISLPDPVAIGIFLDPSLCVDASRHYVDIETESALTRGMTVVDRLSVADDSRNREVWAEVIERDSKATICWELDVTRWKALLFESLRER